MRFLPFLFASLAISIPAAFAADLVSSSATTASTGARAPESTGPSPALGERHEALEEKRDAGAPPKTEGATDGGIVGGESCGPKPLPDCPLQAWMKNNVAPVMKPPQFTALAAAFDAMANFAPPTGYPNWKSISKDGAEAARAQDVNAVKAACRGCHQQYKDKYRAELRARPLP
jgi:hypothetical protein